MRRFCRRVLSGGRCVICDRLPGVRHGLCMGCLGECMQYHLDRTVEKSWVVSGEDGLRYRAGLRGLNEWIFGDVDVFEPGQYGPVEVKEVTVRVLFEYRGVIRWLISELKYREGFWVVPILGGLMAEALMASADDGACIVPMPMHWLRLWQRGYNAAGMLARYAAEESGMMFDDSVLARVRHRVPQSCLSRRHRLINVRGCFRARMGCDKPVIVIDDVLTTGASLCEAVGELKKSNSKQVQAWAFAQAMVTQ